VQAVQLHLHKTGEHSPVTLTVGLQQLVVPRSLEPPDRDPRTSILVQPNLPTAVLLIPLTVLFI
jgi:hypothetical protein